MVPTFIGIAIALVGLLLLFRGTVLAMFSMVVACSLMPGSAALLLPALGGSSIPPVQFALAFMVLRLFVGDTRFDLIWAAIVRNLPLVCFAAYGIGIAMIGPRLFRGAMYVFPMHLDKSGPGTRTVPLVFSPQNVTASIYMIGLLLLSVCASAAMFRQGGARRLVMTAVVVAWVQSFLGVSGALLAHTPWSDFLDLFRNATYAQLDQNFGAFVRIKGIAPEPSSYAMEGFVWFVFLFECWIRGVLPRRTGPAAAVIGLVLLFSTSSTAYLGLGAYGLIFALRAVMIPGTAPFTRMLTLVAAALAAAILVMLIYVVVPSFGAMFGNMLHSMTVGKSASGSGMERATFAHQGIDAFWLTHGLGVGPGSFRSSSLVTAIIGTTGVIGSAAFLLHVLRILKPLRPSTYVGLDDGAAAVGVAASWAAFAVMIPGSMVLPSIDPGAEFAILGGAALALRWVPVRLAARRRPPVGAHGHEVVAAY